MKRLCLGFSVLALAVCLAFAAHAAPKKKGGKKGGQEKVPVSAEISKAMGGLEWGIGKHELLKQQIEKVKEHYRPLVAKTKDSVEEDRLRQEATESIRRIKSSAVDFAGTSTGWDVSFLKGEFTHGNDESMVVVRDENSQNFYFFIGGRLWKWYKAFDSEVFAAGDFNNFAGAVQRKFGAARDAHGELSPGSGDRHWLEWHDDKTRLRAVDQSAFYGFYCLVFEEKATVARLGSLRSNTREVGPKQHALIEAVTARSESDPDSAPDVADRITGKIRARQDAPAASDRGTGGSGKQKSSPAPSTTGVAADDDPLRGLGL